MYWWERTMRDGGCGILHQREIPSFSSSLLDEIYRSIDEECGSDQGFYANLVTGKKQSKCGAKAGGWGESTAMGRETVQRRQVYTEPEKKQRRRRDCDFDHDALFFSSTPSSSDSSSNGFSSSDTESAYGGMKNRVPCFVPLPRPKPVRTEAKKTSQEQRKLPGFDGGNEGKMNSKSRALKIYSNLKKMKQPISPGGKLASFINTLFVANNAATPRKAKQSAMPAVGSSEEESQSGDSSASSFSRSCLSKYSPATATREKVSNRSEMTVKFYPVSMILDEKVNVDKARFITDESRHNPRMDRSSQSEDPAREFLREYLRSQKKIDKTSTTTSRGNDRDYDDDAASCTSSDLFELDHLSVLGNDMYCEELPVYGTTRVGLIM